MNRFRVLMFSTAVFAFLALAAAVRPAIAQQDQPIYVHHRLIPAGDTCATCHKVVYDQWKASPHGAAGVQCTVCHGETTSKHFVAMPVLSTCSMCHTDQVAQLKSDPFMKGKTCVSCHQAHIFVEHQKAASAGE